MKRIPCLENGIFARSTLKPLDSVFNFDEEKKKISLLATNGEWFTVSGLRRTGKTTLVRSVCNTINAITVYVNIWEIQEEEKAPYVLDMIVNEIKNQLKRSRLKEFLGRFEKLSFFCVSVGIRARNQVRLEQALRNLVKKKNVVIILDEIQEMKREEEFFKFLAALHDETAPKLSMIFLGSIISLRDILEASYSKPLHGRISEEIVLEPLKEYETRLMLKKGFEQCDVKVKDEVIREASYRLGGLPGWITHFGRIAVINHYLGKKINVDNIYDKLVKEAEKILYDEIARAISEKRKLRNYIRILKHLGEHGEITVAETARLINKKPNTALIYLTYLIKAGLVTKIKNKYSITDPIIREVLAKKEIEREIKLRL